MTNFSTAFPFLDARLGTGDVLIIAAAVISVAFGALVAFLMLARTWRGTTSWEQKRVVAQYPTR